MAEKPIAIVGAGIAGLLALLGALWREVSPAYARPRGDRRCDFRFERERGGDAAPKTSRP